MEIGIILGIVMLRKSATAQFRVTGNSLRRL